VRRLSSFCVLVALLGSFTVLATPAPAAAEAPAAFTDVPTGSAHADSVLVAAQVGITGGCSDDRFCPNTSVTREQTATFIARGIDLPRDTADGAFVDVAPGSVHEPAVEALRRDGISDGCAKDPPRFCPYDPLTRAQMATMLAEAFDLPPGEESRFTDVAAGSAHAEGIDRLVAAGITRGCQQPGQPATYCPNRDVSRAQVASFLIRALELRTEAFGGRTPCPTHTGPTLTPTTHGPAVPPIQYPATNAVRTSDGLEVLSNDLSPARSARLDDSGQLTATASIAGGSRSWAITRHAGEVYVGQWGVPDGAANVYAFSEAASGDRTATPVATVPVDNEFWSLAADDQGRLYAGSDAHRAADLAPDEHLLHRIDPAADPAERLTPITFTVPPIPTTDARFAAASTDGAVLRGDIKQVVWHDEVLYVGTGQITGATRLYELRDLDAAAGPQVTDITPDALLPRGGDARAVFSLAVDDRVIAVGSHAADATDARIIALDRTDPDRVLADAPLESQSRVDAVAIGDERVLGVAFPSGDLHTVEVATPDDEADTPTVPTAPTTRSVNLGAPVADTSTRYLEVHDGRVTGVAATGTVWQLDAADRVERRVQIADLRGTPAAAGRAQSLTATDTHLAVGSNNAVWVRALGTDRSDPVAVAGEAKALASRGSLVYAATYPTGELWRIDPRTGDAAIIADWDNRWNRPAAMAIDADRGLAYILAANDEQRRPLADGRDETTAGALIGIDLTDGEVRYQLPLTDGTGAEGFLAGTAVAVQPSGDVVIGDLDGRLQRITAASSSPQVVWRHAVGEAAADGRRVAPRIVSVHADGQSVAATTASAGDDEGPARLHLDATDGAVLTTSSVDRFDGATLGATALLGPVHVLTKATSVVAVDRGQDRAVRLAELPRAQTFSGRPVLAVTGGCVLHLIAGHDLTQLVYDARTRITR
jgi:hypothetical protein